MVYRSLVTSGIRLAATAAHGGCSRVLGQQAYFGRRTLSSLSPLASQAPAAPQSPGNNREDDEEDLEVSEGELLEMQKLLQGMRKEQLEALVADAEAEGASLPDIEALMSTASGGREYEYEYDDEEDGEGWSEEVKAARRQIIDSVPGAREAHEGDQPDIPIDNQAAMQYLMQMHGGALPTDADRLAALGPELDHKARAEVMARQMEAEVKDHVLKEVVVRSKDTPRTTGLSAELRGAWRRAMKSRSKSQLRDAAESLHSQFAEHEAKAYAKMKGDATFMRSSPSADAKRLRAKRKYAKFQVGKLSTEELIKADEESEAHAKAKEEAAATASGSGGVGGSTITYGEHEALAYLATRVTGTYGGLQRVMEDIRKRNPKFVPETMLDVGSGPGTAIFAARSVWGVDEATEESVHHVDSWVQQKGGSVPDRIQSAVNAAASEFSSSSPSSPIPAVTEASMEDEIEGLLERALEGDSAAEARLTAIMEGKVLESPAEIASPFDDDSHRHQRINESLDLPRDRDHTDEFVEVDPEAFSAPMTHKKPLSPEELEEMATRRGIPSYESAMSENIFAVDESDSSDLRDHLSAGSALPKEPLSEVVAVEPSTGMQEVCRLLTRDAGVRVHLRRHVGGLSGMPFQLVTAGSVLGELDTDRARSKFVKDLWKRTSGYLVLVEPGTPQGSAIIRKARKTVLDMAAAEVEKRELGGGHEGEAGEAALSQHLELLEDVSPHAHVVAPCPHDGACPLGDALRTDTWCHFSQRTRRAKWQLTSEVRRGGAAGASVEDEKFSYVVLARGARPTEPVTTTPVLLKNHLSREYRDVVASMEEGEDEELMEISNPNDPSAPLSAELPPALDALGMSLVEERVTEMDPESMVGWSRLMRAPERKKKHLRLTLCGSDGEIHRPILTKRKNKWPYRLARKLMWGDRWPENLGRQMLDPSDDTPVEEEKAAKVAKTKQNKKAKASQRAKDRKREKNARARARRAERAASSSSTV